MSEENKGGAISKEAKTLAGAITVVVSLLGYNTAMMKLVVDPMHSTLERVSRSVQRNSEGVADINRRVGNKPRAAADVAKLYERTDSLKDRVTRVEREIDRLRGT